ncbi:phospholipid-transporting ATPase, partial [Elysia marginata]
MSNHLSFQNIVNAVVFHQFMIDTPVTPITSVAPLLFVISITAIKQGYEDYLRHKADNDVNLRPTVIIRNGEVQRGLRAMDVRVGDIVKTYINEEFPCDMVLLSSEDKKGHCFITTANLDGETNLKTHYSQLETRKMRSPHALGFLRASITCKPQSADLYTFQGVMHFGPDADPQPLGPEHLLLRGARLKNTPWIYGCAIYTGKETKMALNSNAKKAKFSRVERKLNTFLLLFLVVLVMGCVVPTTLKYWFENKEGDDPWYFYDEDEDDEDAPGVLETGLAFMVLINYIIPISLYVTIEMQKFFGSLFFTYDVEMYDDELNEPAMANTSDLNEELGQVEYLFTDKTGTLTENSMTFRKCIIGKRCFEEVNGMLCEKVGDTMIPVTDPSYQGAYSFRLRKKFSLYHAGLNYQDPPREMTDFLRVLVLCHTVKVDRQFNARESAVDFSDNENSNSNSPFKWIRHRKKHHESRDSLGNYYDHQEEDQSYKTFFEASDTMIANSHNSNALSTCGSEYSETGQEYEYQASSPDEKAFVEACCKYGTIYHGLVDDIHEVSYRHEIHRFKLLETLPFDAVRKRMSVIIRDAEGDIFLLCKGAEVAIFDKVIEGDIEATQKSIDEYAMCGFRTLCLARRKLTEEEYQDISDKLTAARLSLVDRDAKVAEVYNECEKDLTLLGATAVEDKLQADVPETITALRQAGIKVWVLTGDKEETAVNISHSAGHFWAGMTELRLTQVASLEQCYEQILVLLKEVQSQPKGTKVEYSLVVDGKSLAYALRNHALLLRELCSHCVAVLCCRMSPIQKAEVVHLVKSSPDKPVTAAIGDGANDVSMIQEADVGLGIMGKEGRQAVCNSDYAFGKFRFLRRALLLHGHYYYHRLAVLVKYFFYKNVAWVTCQIYFAIFNYWSQQSLYDPFFLTFYNMTSTSLPILIYGIFEQCKPKNKLVNQPHLYKSITRNASLSWRVFSEWMILALWHSLVFFFIMYFMEDDNTSLFSSGKSIGVYDFGTVIACSGIVAVNVKLMLETYFWCWPLVFAYCFSAAGNLAMATIYTNVFWPSQLATTRDMYGVPGQMYQSPSVWLSMLITIIGALLPDFVLKTLRDNRDALEDLKLEQNLNQQGLSQSSTTPKYAANKESSEQENPSSSVFPSPSWVQSGSSDPPRPHILSTKISLESGKAEMRLRSRQKELPANDSDIE